MIRMMISLMGLAVCLAALVLSFKPSFRETRGRVLLVAWLWAGTVLLTAANVLNRWLSGIPQFSFWNTFWPSIGIVFGILNAGMRFLDAAKLQTKKELQQDKTASK